MIKTALLTLMLASCSSSLWEKKDEEKPIAAEVAPKPKPDPVIAPAGMAKADDKQVIELARSQYAELLKTMDYLNRDRNIQCAAEYTSVNAHIRCSKSYSYLVKG